MTLFSLFWHIFRSIWEPTCTAIALAILIVLGRYANAAFLRSFSLRQWPFNAKIPIFLFKADRRLGELPKATVAHFDHPGWPFRRGFGQQGDYHPTGLALATGLPKQSS